MYKCTPRSLAKFLRGRKLEAQVNGKTVHSKFWCFHFQEETEYVRIWHAGTLPFFLAVPYQSLERIVAKSQQFALVLARVCPNQFITKLQ